MRRGRYIPSGQPSDIRSDTDSVELVALRSRLRLFAARRLGDWTAAEDVAQEALRRGLEAMRNGRIGESGGLPGFLLRTAHHICLHRGRSAVRERRALRRLVAGAEGGSAESPLNQLISAEEQSSIREALGRLHPVERRILEMSYRDELDSAEIGRRLGLSAGAVRVRRHRALRRLADSLGVTKRAYRESRGVR